MREKTKIEWFYDAETVNWKMLKLLTGRCWIFIGKTDAETEAPVLWPPDEKNWHIGKDPDAGKDWGKEEKGKTENEMIGWHHQFNGHEFEQTWGELRTGKPGMLQSMGSQRVKYDWATEKQQQYGSDHCLRSKDLCLISNFAID